MKLERQKKTDFVVLSALNLSGPEFTFSSVLPAGTKLQVLSARRCTNCPFEIRIDYHVTVKPEPPQFAGKPVYLVAEPTRSGHVVCEARNGAA